eukprot:4631829-Alexandrium_andersonii.AAC.1
MSASLVGSEMCIRDRGLTVGRAGTCRKQFPVLSCPGGLPPPPDRPIAVSYTHLTLPTICSV